MKVSHLIILTAILAVVCGLTFVLWSPMLLPLFGVSQIPVPVAGDVSAMSFWQSAAFARVFGALLVSFGLLVWTVRRVVETEAGQPLIFALSVGCGFVSLISLTQQIAFWETGAGKLVVFGFLGLAIGYGYFWVRRLREV